MFMVEFSYKLASGKTKYEKDTTGTAWTAQEAADKIREWYGDLANLRIHQVWVDRSGRWEVTEAWD